MPRRAELPEDTTTVEIPINGGMHSGGDAAKIPSGFFRKIRNMLREAAVWEKRPQFTYDSLASVRGLGVWRDSTNNVTRLMSVDSSNVVRAKGASGETWGSSAGTLSDSVIRDSTTMDGKWYAIQQGGGANGLYAFNGTATSLVVLNGWNGGLAASAVYPWCMTVFKSRMFFGGLQLDITNALTDTLGTTYTYNAANWTRTNITSANITVSGSTVGRITPTNTVTANMTAPSRYIGGLGENDYVYWRANLKGTSPSYTMPMTLKLTFIDVWGAAETYAVGNVRVPTTSNDLRYRVSEITTGISGGGEPAWPVTVGGTVVDNGVTWICDGSNVAAQQKISVPSLAEDQSWGTYWVRTYIQTNASCAIGARLEFGHDGAAFTLAPIDFSLEDGRTNGDPLKKNYGQQITGGAFEMPFCNSTSNATTIQHRDYLYYTDINEPERVSANRYHRVADVTGPITAVVACSGKLIVFKRNATWTFDAVENANLVVLPEGEVRRTFGCLHPRAADTFNDTAYFIGEDEIYRWRPGMDAAEGLCGDAMRDEIMSKSASSWVESQSSPANVPLLKVDPKRRRMYAYTQKGKIYVYDLDDEAWSVLDAGGDTSVSPVGKQICAMEYSQNTGNMYFAFTEAPAGTAGLARLDESQSPAKDSYSTSGTSDVHAELWPKPFELTGPRHELLLDNVKFYHKATASQTGQTTTAYVSRDHGITFPKSNQVTLAPVSTGGYRPMRISLFQSWGSLLLRILHSGSGGATSFNVSRMEADIQILSGEYTKDLPTSGVATL